MIRRNPELHVSPRGGYTLIELVVSSISATLLLAGLASAVFISARGLDGTSRAAQRSRAADVQAVMLADLSEATSFSDRTSTSVSFSVPDRNSDGNEETLTYSWASGPGELRLSYNGSPATTLLENVTDFNFSYGTRSISSSAQPPAPYDPNDWGTRWMVANGAVTFQEFTEAKLGFSGNELGIDTPYGTAEGDLLVAAIAIDNSANPVVPAGWTPLLVDDVFSGVTFAVCWKIAGASEPASVRFEWGSDEQAYGWIMRFTGHDPVNPIHDTDDRTAFDQANPTCRDVDTSVKDALILRLGAFDDDDVNVDDPGLSNHVTITMDASSSGSGTVSGGAGYFTLPVAGNSGTAAFNLTGSEESITITIAIAPDPS